MNKNKLKKLGLYLGIAVLNIAALYTFFRNHNDNPGPVNNRPAAEDIADVSGENPVEKQNPEQSPLESAVKETTPQGNSAGEPSENDLIMEQKLAELKAHIRKVEEMPRIFTSPDNLKNIKPIKYNQIRVVIFNGVSDVEYFEEIEEIYDSLIRAGVDDKSITVLCNYDKKDLEQRARALGIKQGTKENLFEALKEDEEPGTLSLVYITGEHTTPGDKRNWGIIAGETEIDKYELLDYLNLEEENQENKRIIFLGFHYCEPYIRDLKNKNQAAVAVGSTSCYHPLEKIFKSFCTGVPLSDAIRQEREDRARIIPKARELGLAEGKTSRIYTAEDESRELVKGNMK